jgi:hypothetical protein
MATKLRHKFELVLRSALSGRLATYIGRVIPWSDGSNIVDYPDGRRIRGRGLRDPLPEGLAPHFGLYLLNAEPPAFPWEQRWVRWGDFRVPVSADDTVAALAEAYRRAEYERVEVACKGGVGRTGTALAAIAVLAGVPPAEAVVWVRHRYNRHAVETPWQRRWVLKVDLARGSA